MRFYPLALAALLLTGCQSTQQQLDEANKKDAAAEMADRRDCPTGKDTTPACVESEKKMKENQDKIQELRRKLAAQ